MLGFKPRLSSHIERGPSSSGVNRRVPRDSEVNRENHAVLKEKRRGPRSSDGVNRRGPCGFGVLIFATWLRQQERLCQEEKGRKDSFWWAVRRCHMALD